MRDRSFILDDVLSTTVGEQLRDAWSEARDVSETEWSTVASFSRVLHRNVVLTLLGGEVFQGTVTRILTDAVLLDDHTLVRGGHIAMIQGHERSFPLEVETVRLSARSVLRSWVNRPVLAVFSDGRTLRTTLKRVGADYAECDAALLRLDAVSVWRVLA